jgi:hypothetical protein
MDDIAENGKVARMRGWGYYTGKGHGALGLDPDEAVRRTRLTGEHIARLDPATARELVAGYRRGLAGEEREREARAALAKVTEERDALARVRDGYLPDPSDPPALKDRDGRFADGYRCAQHDLHAWFAAWIKSRNDPRARIILHAAITNLGWAFARQRKRLHETRIHSTLEVPYVGRM